MEAYIEHMVKKKSTIKDLALRYFFMFLVVLSVLAALLLMYPPVLVITVGLWAIYRYLIYPLTDIEYEYLYVDRTLTVDKIMAKEKRKTIATYEIDRLEILAPADSYRLGEFKNRELKTVDYSSGTENTEDMRCVMIYEGGLKIVLDLTKEFVKIIQNNSPRKVFLD
ncbi:MAG: hypothetical protein K6B44_00195 [Lachnospiraceae bacterium]|nr:hypothetical protein [Lachnospiraceae bacterium]